MEYCAGCDATRSCTRPSSHRAFSGTTKAELQEDVSKTFTENLRGYSIFLRCTGAFFKTIPNVALESSGRRRGQTPTEKASEHLQHNVEQHDWNMRVHVHEVKLWSLEQMMERKPLLELRMIPTLVESKQCLVDIFRAEEKAQGE